MNTKIARRRPALGWVALAVAVVMASAGSAVAATLVTSKQIKNHTIKMIDINNNTVKSLQYSQVPSGTTIRGVWGGIFQPVDANRNFHLEFISFPLPLATPLKDAKVKFGLKGVNGSTSASIQAEVNDEDESSLCTGTFRKPTAPRGMVCVYVRDSFPAFNVLDGSLAVDPPEADATPAPNKYGFVIGWAAGDTSFNARTEGTWAYTAP